MIYSAKVFRISANGIEPNSSWPQQEKDPAPEQIDLAREWLRTFAAPTKSISKTHSSYALKHAVERWTAQHGERKYISNGAFIVAAAAEGFRVVRTDDGSLNAFFNFSIRRTARGSAAA